MAIEDGSSSTGPVTEGATVRLQSITIGLHSFVVFCVIVSTFVLAYQGHLTSDAVVGLYGAIVGYSGGAIASRSGNRAGERR